MSFIKYKQDHLRSLGEKYINNPKFDFESIKRIDITTEFFQQWKLYHETGTLVVANFNGHTTDGKSTAAAVLTQISNKYQNREMKSQYILGNQQEYANWVGNNPKLSHITLQIDEWSRLAETGANATIEQAYLDELSNIHAQMFINKIYCSPHQLPDPNIIVHLEVASKDIKNQTTVCYVYYNLSRGGTTIPQIIGHIVLDVSEVLASEWYKEYRINKFKKMTLLREYNIVHERELFYAKAIREIVYQLVGYTQMGKYVTPRRITSKAKVYSDQNGIRLTMLGISFAIVEPVQTILDLHTDSIKFANDIAKLDNKERKNQGDILKSDMLKEQRVSILKDIAYFDADLKQKERLFLDYKQIGSVGEIGKN